MVCATGLPSKLRPTKAMVTKVRKAVIPAAGLGTRMLPATKAVPKEMLPIVDRPAIQRVVEECVASGIELVVLVSGRYKGSIEDHFDVSYEVEDVLTRGAKAELLDRIAGLSKMVDIVSVRQNRPLGLGHAVLTARPVIGDEDPFAVLLPDDLIDSDPPATKLLADAYAETGHGAVGLVEVPASETHRYGVVAGEEVAPGRILCTQMVEKPPAGTAPSNLAIAGRYVLPGEIFRHLANTTRGSGGEIQLTDALVKIMETDAMYGVTLGGRRYDTGGVAGWLEANIGYAMKDPELRAHILQVVDRYR